MTVECPSCQGVFRVRIDRLPPQGAKTKCARCGGMIHVDAGGARATDSPPPSPATPERGPDGLFDLPTPRAAAPPGSVDLFALDQPGLPPIAPAPAAVAPAVFAHDQPPQGAERRPGVFGWLFRFLG